MIHASTLNGAIGRCRWPVSGEERCAVAGSPQPRRPASATIHRSVRSATSALFALRLRGVGGGHREMSIVDGSQVAVAALLLAIDAPQRRRQPSGPPRTRSCSIVDWRSVCCPGCRTSSSTRSLSCSCCCRRCCTPAFFADLPALRRDAGTLTHGDRSRPHHVRRGRRRRPRLRPGRWPSPSGRSLISATAISAAGVQRRIVNLVEGKPRQRAAALVTYRVARRGGGRRKLLVRPPARSICRCHGGWAVGLIFRWSTTARRIDDPLTSITVSLLTGYAATCQQRRTIRRPGRRDGGAVSGLALARARRPGGGDRRVGGAHVPAQRHLVHPHRAAIARRCAASVSSRCPPLTAGRVHRSMAVAPRGDRAYLSSSTRSQPRRFGPAIFAGGGGRKLYGGRPLALP